MKSKMILSLVMMTGAALISFTQPSGKYTSDRTHIKFFSTTPAEDIEATNVKAVSTMDPQTGAVVFSVPMQSFEFEKALMQKHFNQPDFLDTKSHPKAKMTGKIDNISEIDLSKLGTYPVTITGQMEIKGKSNPFTAKGNIKVAGDKLITDSKFNITLSDYGIAFQKGKPSTNIAKTVEVTVSAEYKAANQ